MQRAVQRAIIVAITTAAVLAEGTAVFAAPDILFANSGNLRGKRDRACLGDGNGGFVCSFVDDVNDISYGVALGDLNGDFYLDAVFTQPEVNQACLGDGSSRFRCVDVVGEEDSFGVALGHVDGDAHLDAVFANTGIAPPQPNRVCLGDGTGGFSCSDVSSDVRSSRAVALGHVNGDPHLDAVFANTLGANRVCFGDGTGRFVCGPVSGDNNTSQGVALGHVNGDAALDIVFANTGAPNQVCLGDGAGRFFCFHVSGDANSANDVALGHLNGDPHLDAVFANDGSNRLCLGDGAGAFACSEVGTDVYTSAVALEDMNEDGFLDIVFANLFGPNEVCLGTGAGGFDCASLGEITEYTSGVAVAYFGTPPPCELDLGLHHSANRLTLQLGLGATVPTTWSIALSVGDDTVPIVREPLPEIDPPVSFAFSIPFPDLGRVGVLSSLSTPSGGIVCDVWKTVDTSPE